jgi:hypothetical protein
MGPRIFFPAMILLLLLSGCQTPTEDMDAPAKALIVGKAWTTDADEGEHDSRTMTLLCYSDGRALITGKWWGTWTYKAHVFTLIWDDKSGVTENPELTDHRFVFNFDGDVCHLSR